MNYVVKKGKPLQAHFAQISFIYHIWLQTHQQTLVSEDLNSIMKVNLVIFKIVES